MKIKLLLALSLIASMFATSCNKDDKNDWVSTQEYPACFANIVEENSADTKLVGDMRVGLSVNFTKVTSEVTINGLKLPDGSSFQSIKLSEMPITQVEGWFHVDAANPKVDTGSTVNIPEISNFRLRLLERVFGNGVNAQYYPALAVSFTINSKYTVYITRQIQLFAATTRCTGGPTDFSSQETLYGFTLDPAEKYLEIMMDGAKFMEGMPKMVFTLKKIPFTMQGDAVFFAIDEVTPTVGNMPNDRFPISRLSGSIDPEKGFSLMFDCTPATVEGMRFTVTASGTYTEAPAISE